MKNVRLHFAISEDLRDRLERVRVASGAASMTEVLRRSLQVYEDLLLAMQKEGCKIIYEHPDGSRERLKLL